MTISFKDRITLGPAPHWASGGFVLTKHFEDSTIGSGKFFYTGYKRNQFDRMWHKHPGYNYPTKGSALRALRSLDDPFVVLEVVVNSDPYQTCPVDIETNSVDYSETARISTKAWDFSKPVKVAARDRGFDVYELLGDGDIPIRVGASEHLSKRLDQYKGDSRTYDREICMETKAIKIYRFTSQAEMIDYEKSLIAKFKPKYNIEGVTKAHSYDNRPRADVYMLRAA